MSIQITIDKAGESLVGRHYIVLPRQAQNSIEVVMKNGGDNVLLADEYSLTFELATPDGSNTPIPNGNITLWTENTTDKLYRGFLNNGLPILGFLTYRTLLGKVSWTENSGDDSGSTGWFTVSYNNDTANVNPANFPHFWEIPGVPDISALLQAKVDAANIGSTAYEWLVGAGAPDPGDGVETQYHLDTDTGDLYKKESSTWNLKMNILGVTLNLQNYESDSDAYSTTDCVFVDANDNVIAVFSDASAELAALQALFDKTHDAQGLSIEPLSGAGYLLDWPRKLADLQMGESVLAKVLCLGDSWVKGGSNWVTYLTKILTARYGDGGIGIVSLGRDTSSAVLCEGSDEALTVLTFTGTQPVPSYDGGGINLTGWNPQVAGNKVSIQLSSTATAETAEIHYLEYSGGGVFRYRFNGGDWTEIDTDGAGGYTVASLTGVPGTANFLLEVELVSGDVFVYHVDLQKAEGVRVHRAGHGGARADHYAGAASTWDAAFTELDPDLTIISLGTNDMKDSGLTPAEYYTQMTSLVTTIRGLKTRADILLLAPAENLSTHTNPATAYRDKLRQVAYENNCAFADGPLMLGDTTNYDDSAPRTLFTSGDPLHPTAEGDKLITTQLLKLIDL